MKTAVSVLLLVLAATAFADWTSIGPEGGPMYSGTVTPTSPPTVYVASTAYNAPLLKTTDGGTGWVQSGAVLGNYPWVLLSHPTDTNRMYGAISSLFYSTTNAGATWSQYSFGSNTIAYDIALNPLNTQELYACGYKWDGAYWRISAMKTTDAGANWTAVQLDTATTAYGYSVAIDPVDTTVVYAGGYAGTTSAFYKSTDCGANWTKIDLPENAYYVYSIVTSPVDHNIVFAGTLYGIFRSTDAGLTWSKRSTGNYNYRIAFAPDDPSIMYSAAYSGVYRSTDAGLNWTYETAGLAGINLRFVLTVPGESGAVYCGSSAGMFKSTDYGVTWEPKNSGILIGNIPVVSFDPGAPGTAFAEFVDNAIFKTTDDGLSWERQPTVLSCGNVCNILIEADNPQLRWMFEASG